MIELRGVVDRTKKARKIIEERVIATADKYFYFVASR